MSASKEIKSIGLPSLKYVADKIKVNPNRLHEWYKTRPDKFRAIIHGVKVMDEMEKRISFNESVKRMMKYSSECSEVIDFDE